MVKIVDQYLLVVQMLEARGTPRFYEFSRRLYGSPKDNFIEDKNSIVDMSRMLYETLSGVDSSLPDFPEDLPAEEVVRQLNQRFCEYFGEDEVLAKLSDDIVADAAAGGDVVKIREKGLISRRNTVITMIEVDCIIYESCY